MPGKRLNLDWEALKYEYTVSGISLSKMAEKYGCSFSTLANHCHADHWKEARGEYRKKTFDKASEMASDEAGNRLFSLMEASNALDRMIFKVCTLADDENNESLDVKILKDLAATIKDAIAIKRDLWNLPKENVEGAEITVRFEDSEDFTE